MIPLQRVRRERLRIVTNCMSRHRVQLHSQVMTEAEIRLPRGEIHGERDDWWEFIGLKGMLSFRNVGGTTS